MPPPHAPQRCGPRSLLPGLVLGMALLAVPAAKADVSLLEAPTAASLAANPSRLLLAHFDRVTLLDDWSGVASELSLATLGQPRGVAVGPGGALYVATDFALGWAEPGETRLRWKTSFPLPVQALTLDASGNPVLAAGGNLVLMPGGPGAPYVLVPLPAAVSQPRAIAVDPEGNVGVISSRNGGGFAVVGDPLGSPWTVLAGPQHGFVDPMAQAVGVDGRGRFAVGTASGLFVATGLRPQPVFTRLDARDGLPSDSVTALAPWGEGGLAIGTIAGLALWDGGLAAPGIEALTTQDGLLQDWIPALTADGTSRVLATQPGAVAVVGAVEIPAEQTACADGRDNDGDGFVDAGEDPGCEGTEDSSETSAELVCDDGSDNDGDGLVDAADPGCPSPLAWIEDPPCDDGLDNDGDGLVDLDDPQCVDSAALGESNGRCGLGFELALVMPPLALLRRRRRPVPK